MSAKNETIADIAAFIRKCLDLLDTELSRKSNGKPTMSAEALLCPVLNAKAALDRLDEAWKLEQNPAPKSPAPTTCVNAAALREVLVSISSIDTRSLNRLLYELVENDIPDGGLINKIIANVNKAKAALAEPPDPIGNNAKMRDALVWLQKTGYRTPEGGWMCITLKMTQKDGMPYPIEVPPYAEDVINAALSEAPRNCDVGTANQQSKRFSDFCAAHRHTDLPRCAGCPLENTPPDTGCSFAWAQMPYEAEKGEGK